MTEGTRTPAQQRWEMSITKRDTIGAAFQRAEEVGTDVRALAATVDELKREQAELRAGINTEVSNRINLGHLCDIRDKDARDRLAALESPVSAASNCVHCGKTLAEHTPLAKWCTPHPDDWHMFTPGNAEAAPEPVCQNCKHAKRYHKDFCRADHAFEDGPCGCKKFVPAELAAPVPTALDPVLVKSINELCDLVDWLAHGTVHMIGTGMCGEIFARTTAIRAYGADAREGGR